MGEWKWQKAATVLTLILLGTGILIYSDLFGVLFNLKGINYTYSGDSNVIGGVGEAYINVTTIYWRVCFAGYDDTKYSEEILFKKQSRSRTLHVNLDKVDNVISTVPNVPVTWLVPARGKGNWRPIKDGDCWDRKKINKIKLVGNNITENIKWSFVVGDYVDIDPIWYVKAKEKDVNYTHNTKTECSNGKCNLIVYSGTRLGYEDNRWKPIAELKSLKDSTDIKCIVDYDGTHQAECLDFNYTHRKIRRKVNPLSNIDKTKIPLKIYKRNGTLINSKIEDLTKEKEEWVKIDFGDVIHIGKNSTTIKLQEPNSENLGDTLVYQDNPNGNYGTDTFLYVMSAGTSNARTYIKFNLSIIPSTSIIENSELWLYAWNDATGSGGNYSVYHVYDSTWNETNLTWNYQPCGTGFDNSIQCNLTEKDNSTLGLGWMNWNISNTVKQKHDDVDKKISMVIKHDVEGKPFIERRFYRSKEYTTDITLRPYLNVTYFIPQIIYNVTLLYPLNASTVDYSRNLTYNVSIPMKNCSLWLNQTGYGRVINQTWTGQTGYGISPFINWTWNITPLSQRDYLWNTKCYDNSSPFTEYWAENNWTFTLSTGVGDTCDCSSIQAGTTIDCSENCDIETCDANGQDLFFDNAGTIEIIGNITNHGNITGVLTTGPCIAICNRGCFQNLG